MKQLFLSYIKKYAKDLHPKYSPGPAVFLGLLIFSMLFPVIAKMPGAILRAPAPPETLPRTENLKEGVGAEIKPGSRVKLHYWTLLRNGRTLDASLGRGRPLEIVAGHGQVIAGIDRGILGMREGGVRRIVVDPALGYGAWGIPNIVPGQATLTFEISAVSVSQ